MKRPGRPTASGFDQRYWDALWARTLRERPEVVAGRPPSPHVIREIGDLPAGRALDAGCGHGAETLWLATRGWHVTAVDFAERALAHGRARAEAAGTDVARRIAWTEGDLACFDPAARHYDLVVCLYVHVAGEVAEMVRRLAGGVAPGGTLLLIGHRPLDPVTGAATAAADQVQVSVERATAALDPREFSVLVAEERPHPVAGTGVDAVIRARRHPVA